MAEDDRGALESLLRMVGVGGLVFLAAAAGFYLVRLFGLLSLPVAAGAVILVIGVRSLIRARRNRLPVGAAVCLIAGGTLLAAAGAATIWAIHA